MKKFYVLAAAAALLFTACKKDKIEVIDQPQATSERTMEDFYQENFNNKLQRFIVDAGSEVTLTGAEGSILTIPANNFLDKAGNLVTGNIEVQFIEVFSKGDMILLNKPTVTSTGETLLSAGEFYLNYVIPGTNEVLTPINLIKLDVPSENPNPDMKLWVDNGKGWELAPADDRAPDGVLDPYDAGYIAMVTGGWLNFDLVYAFGPTKRIHILVPPGTSPAVTSVFISIDGMSTVINVDASHYDPALNAYVCDAPSTIPITIGVIQMDAAGDNTYDIQYSSVVTLTGPIFNFTVLSNGSVFPGMAFDLSTLP
jgi:hypothetical protein